MHLSIQLPNSLEGSGARCFRAKKMGFRWFSGFQGKRSRRQRYTTGEDFPRFLEFQVEFDGTPRGSDATKDFPSRSSNTRRSSSICFAWSLVLIRLKKTKKQTKILKPKKTQNPQKILRFFLSYGESSTDTKKIIKKWCQPLTFSSPASPHQAKEGPVKFHLPFAAPS